MTPRSRRRLADIIGGASAFLISLVTFVLVAPLDPEPYHDGSQLPAAIAFSEGLVVHRDVFSAYGFITPWIQGLAVEVFGPQLIVIRMLTAVLLAIVSLEMYVLARWVSRSSVMALGLTLVWVVAWPGRAVIWGTPLLPWPSVIYLVFQLGAVLLVLRALLFSRHRVLNFGLAGVLTGIAVLTRINYGAALTLTLVVILILFTRSRGITAKCWTAALVGGVAGIGIPLLVVAAQGAFPAFIDQSIIGPLQGKAIVSPTPWFYYENAYLWGSALLLVTLLVVLWWGSARWMSTKLYVVMVTLATMGLTVWATTAIEGSPLRSLILSKVTWAPALDGQAMQPVFLSALMTALFAVAVVVFSIAWVLKHRRIRGTESQVIFAVLALTGIASLVQLYPVADPNHLWWAAPIPLVALLYGLTVTAPTRTRWAVTATLVIPAILVSVWTSSVYFSKPRTEITSGTLAGMKIEDARIQSIERVDTMLKDVGARTASFDCMGGLFAVWNGEFLASGPGYADYSYLLESATPATPPQRQFVCIQWTDQVNAEQILADRGLEIVRRSGEIDLSYFTYVDLIEVQPEIDGGQ